jgi:hypothetical protein
MLKVENVESEGEREGDSYCHRPSFSTSLFFDILLSANRENQVVFIIEKQVE